MQRRSGVTLVEVLVAIFIMGIGLIALLTLFPIGVLRMAQAIRDDNASQAAATAHALSIMNNLRGDLLVGSNPLTSEPDLFQNPGALLAKPRTLVSADPFGESYAIYADPVGWSANFGDWVGGHTGYLRRRPVSYVPSGGGTLNTPQMLRNFKLLDTLTFDRDFDPTILSPTPRPGTPTVIVYAPTGPVIQRNPIYSWAYLLRRPQTVHRSVVDCAVVVYDKRSTIVSGEMVFENSAYFDPINNSIFLDTSVQVPNIRTGDWLYDATVYQIPPTAVNPTPYMGAHSYFYRVVAAEDVSVAGKTFAKYEVQTPMRGFISGPSNGRIPKAAPDPTGSVNPIYPGTVIVMDRVIEVFEKGPTRLP